MNKKRILLLGASLALTAGLSACGRAASAADAADFAEGVVNSGEDKNVGVVSDDDAVVNVGGSSMRDENGACVNNTDGDALCNEEDDDIDNDGIANVDDSDIDGDKTPNTMDEDTDGDGVKNIDDNDTDGDGVANVHDSDIDGDDIKNTDDDDIDGDGVTNENDNDTDGDGLVNEKDPDADSDGLDDATVDTDDDSDGVADSVDTDADGDGIADSGSESGKLAYFSTEGTVSLDVVKGAEGGDGSKNLYFDDLRDEAEDENADVSTVTPYDILVKLDNSALSDDAVQALLSQLDDATCTIKVYYSLPGGTKVLIGSTIDGSSVPVTQLVNGVSFADNTLLPTKYYATFQGLFAKEEYEEALITVELGLSEKVGGAATVPLYYEVKANAKVAI